MIIKRKSAIKTYSEQFSNGSHSYRLISHFYRDNLANVYRNLAFFWICFRVII